MKVRVSASVMRHAGSTALSPMNLPRSGWFLSRSVRRYDAIASSFRLSGRVGSPCGLISRSPACRATVSSRFEGGVVGGRQFEVLEPSGGLQGGVVVALALGPLLPGRMPARQPLVGDEDDPIRRLPRFADQPAEPH